MVINGSHAVIEALKRQSQGTIYIHRQQKFFKLILSLARKNNSRIEICSLAELKAKGTRQGVRFVINSAPDTFVPHLSQWLSSRQDKSLGILILDHILDPQNLGAIIRSATLLNIDLVIQPERRTAPENDLSARSAAGGMSLMPRYYDNNLSSVVKTLQSHNIWVYALEMQGTDISNYSLPDRAAFILGNEHKGVSRLLKEHCDELLSISNNKKLDSFNVSVSAALVCYEYHKALQAK